MCWFTYDKGRTIGIVAKNDIEVYKVMVMKPLEDEELFYSAYRCQKNKLKTRTPYRGLTVM